MHVIIVKTFIFFQTSFDIQYYNNCMSKNSKPTDIVVI